MVRRVGPNGAPSRRQWRAESAPVAGRAHRYGLSMSLTLDEARARAAQLSDVAYDIELDLTDPAADTFGCRTRVTFTSAGPDTFLELSGARDLEVLLDGGPRHHVVRRAPDRAHRAAHRRAGRRGGDRAGPVRHRRRRDAPFTDPADGETLPVGLPRHGRLPAGLRLLRPGRPQGADHPDRARRPGLDGARQRPGRERGDGTWRFATTPPIPPTWWSSAPGPWHSVTWEHRGLPFGWHARRSLAAELDRDADGAARAHRGAASTTTPSCSTSRTPSTPTTRSFVPGQNWGALETPGCVTYRDELLPRGRVSEPMRVRRATIVAHEMAHMWFGNLVTMRWWEDTWLNESFADYMGYRVGERRRRVRRHAGLLRGAAQAARLRRRPAPLHPPGRAARRGRARRRRGVRQLRRRSPTPRATPCCASSSPGSATRRSWPASNAHLAAHRFGNATLADFVDALDAASDRDVRGWVEAWLRRSGFDTIRVERDGDGVPVLTREGVRPHRLRVTAYDVALAADRGRVPLVDVADEPVRLEDWAGRVVVPNSHGETFARAPAGRRSRGTRARAGLSGVDDVAGPHGAVAARLRAGAVAAAAGRGVRRRWSPPTCRPSRTPSCSRRCSSAPSTRCCCAGPRRATPRGSSRWSPTPARAGWRPAPGDPERALACTRGLARHLHRRRACWAAGWPRPMPTVAPPRASS